MIMYWADSALDTFYYSDHVKYAYEAYAQGYASNPQVSLDEFLKRGCSGVEPFSFRDMHR